MRTIRVHSGDRAGRWHKPTRKVVLLRGGWQVFGATMQSVKPGDLGPCDENDIAEVVPITRVDVSDDVSPSMNL